MRVNSSAESALHIMLLLAVAPAGREMAANDLADFHNLSRPTLSKVLQQLASARLVVGSSGRRGGYKLARPAAEISVYDVAAAIDGVEPRFHCHEIRRVGPCAGAKGDYSPRCAIARTMDAATAAWRATLAAITVADLAAMTANEITPDIKRRTANWYASHIH